MKELMVPLLIVLSTGIVVGQQPLQTEENRGSSILDGSSDNFAPLSSTRRLFAGDTEASSQRPTPDFDAPESTTTRQQAGAQDYFQPLLIPVEVDALQKIAKDGELNISDVINPRDRPFITGLEIALNDVINDPNAEVKTVFGRTYNTTNKNNEVEKVLRFELSDDQLNDLLKSKKLRYVFRDGERGTIDRFQFASHVAVGMLEKSNPSELTAGNQNAFGGGAQSFQPGPALGSVEFEGPVRPPVGPPNMFARQRPQEQDTNRVATRNEERPSVNFANNANGFGQDDNGIAPRNPIQFPNRRQGFNARPTNNGGNEFAGNNRSLPPLQPFGNGVNNGQMGQSQTEMTPAQKRLYWEQLNRLDARDRELTQREAQAEAERQESTRRQVNPRFANQSGAFGGERTDFAQGQTILPPAATPPTVIDDMISVSSSRLAALEAAKNQRHAKELDEMRREIAWMRNNPNQQFSGLQNAGYQQAGNNQRLVSKVSTDQSLGNLANPNSFDENRPGAMRGAADGSVQVADAKTDIPLTGISSVDFAKQKTEIERLQLLAKEEIRKRKSRESGMFLLLIPSIALNMFLIWMYRSAYVRYDELADDLRETFNSSN